MSERLDDSILKVNDPPTEMAIHRCPAAKMHFVRIEAISQGWGLTSKCCTNERVEGVVLIS